MTDKLILSALIEAHGEGWSGEIEAENANKVAQKILDAGFKLRDPDLEARVDRIERWMRGEFS